MQVKKLTGAGTSVGSCESIKSFDLFGEKVNFTFHSKNYFTTYLGAIVSIFCIALMTAFFVLRTQRIVLQQNPFFSMST